MYFDFLCIVVYYKRNKKNYNKNKTKTKGGKMSDLDLKFSVVEVQRPVDINVNVILGQTHFIKTIEDIYEALVSTVPNIKFGIAFAEASGVKKIRYDGNDDEMIDFAVKNMKNIKAGHSFIIFLKDAYPINVLNSIKMVPEVCHIYAATANPLQVVIAETKQGRGIMGVIDGQGTGQLETKEDKKERQEFLRKIGYKL